MNTSIDQVLFLDIDGVLNSTQFFIWREGQKRSHANYTELDDFCPICVSNLNHILELCPELKIVISSSWRVYRKLDTLKELFKQVGIKEWDRVIDMTPFDNRLDQIRGDEIQEWLNFHPEVKEFAIVDDDSDMGHLVTHFFKTNAKHGLSLEIAQQIILKFNPKAGIFNE